MSAEPVSGRVGGPVSGRVAGEGHDGWDDGWTGRVVVDLDAIAANTARLVQLARAPVMAVVKADAYGHGLLPSAQAALAGGASWLGVAQVAEALALRAAGVSAPVLAWLMAPGQDLTGAVAAGVDLSASSTPALDVIAQAARRAGRPARVHLKVDTGLGRGGVTVDAWPQLVREALRMAEAGSVEVVGAWSHFAFADAPGHPTVRSQLDVLLEAVSDAERLGATFAVRHLANSAATLSDPAAHLDLVRPGVAVYGLSPGLDLGSAASLGLRPAMRLQARLALVKDVPAGQGVSYGHTYTTASATRLALVPLGYADGVPRHASNAGPVAVGGGTVRVAGRVCMDQFVLDLAGLGERGAGVRAGDVVELFGDGTEGGPTAQDWARAAGTIGYEIIARVSSRLPRVYVGTAGVTAAATGRSG